MTNQVLTIPDVVALALPYLRTALNDVTITVAASVPNPRPAGRLVTLRRAGGSRKISNIVGVRRIDAQVWASSEFAALQLADTVEAHLLAAPGRVAGVTAAASFLGPVPIPDDASGEKRALLTVSWEIKGSGA